MPWTPEEGFCTSRLSRITDMDILKVLEPSRETRSAVAGMGNCPHNGADAQNTVLCWLEIRCGD